MMIQDLEFCNSFNQEQQGDTGIVGGSSFDGYSTVTIAPNNISATSEAAATGNYTGTATNSAATIAVQPGYSTGYGATYSAGYGVDAGGASLGSTQAAGVLK